MTARLDSILPRRNLWAEVAGAASVRDGWMVRGEVGAALGNSVAGFLGASVTPDDRRVEAGVRVTF